MRASSTRRGRPRRYTARVLIKLDAEAQARFEVLRTAVGRLPPQVLRQLIDWGLSHGGGWRVDRRRVVDPAAAIVVRLEPAVRTQLHAAAGAAGGDASAWVCHALGQVTLADLRAPRQTGEAESRSHDSHYYDQRYMLRLDDATRAKLDRFAQHFNTSVAEVIRQVVAQTEIEDFPETWQMPAGAGRTHPRPEASTRRRQPRRSASPCPLESDG